MECPFSGKLSLFLIFGPIIGSKRVLSRQIIMGHAMWYGKQSKQVRHFNSAQCEGCWKVVLEVLLLCILKRKFERKKVYRFGVKVPTKLKDD